MWLNYKILIKCNKGTKVQYALDVLEICITVFHCHSYRVAVTVNGEYHTFC